MVACFLRKKMNKPPNLKNTRTIWLLDAMFSCGGKILARQTMEAAKKVGALADEKLWRSKRKKRRTASSKYKADDRPSNTTEEKYVSCTI